MSCRMKSTLAMQFSSGPGERGGVLLYAGGGAEEAKPDNGARYAIFF